MNFYCFLLIALFSVVIKCHELTNTLFTKAGVYIQLIICRIRS